MQEQEQPRFVGYSAERLVQNDAMNVLVHASRHIWKHIQGQAMVDRPFDAPRGYAATDAADWAAYRILQALAELVNIERFFYD